MATTTVRESFTAPDGGAVSFLPWPEPAHLVDVDLAVIGPVVARITAGEMTADLFDLPTGFGWKVVVKRQGFEQQQIYYITGQLAELLVPPAEHLDLGAIPRVDPDTLEPTEDVLAAWAAIAAQVDDLEEEAEALTARVEQVEESSRGAFAGVLATLRRGHRSTCIALIGDSTGDGKEVGTGVLVDEWPQVFLKRLGQDFPGYTVLERRWNDTNQAYDQPITHQVGTLGAGAERFAQFATATPGALQYAGAAITGDIDIRVKLSANDWTPASDQVVAAKWDSTGNNRSWLFLLKASGALAFNWSTTGAAGIGEKVSTVTLGATADPADGSALWVRATLDVDNGAGGNDLKFYYSTDGTVWTQLGATVTTAAATSIFGGTAPYQLGSFTSGFSTPLGGKVHRTEIHPGLAGALGAGASVVPYLPDDWEYQSASSTITLGGAPVLMLLNGSQSGQNVVYFDGPTRRTILHQPHGQTALLINTGHNDGTQAKATWLAAYSAMVTNIKALLPFVPIVALAQNPAGVGGTFNLNQADVELRATRGAMLQQWAVSQAGVWIFDAWPLLTAADTVDQLHPTTGPGSGAEKWGLGLYRRTVAAGLS